VKCCSWKWTLGRVWLLVVWSTASVMVASCSTPSATRPERSGYSVSLSRILGDANIQNHGNPYFVLAPSGTKVSMLEKTAADAVIRECNEGAGTRVLVAGLVTGPVSFGSTVYWAIFVDPPGKHIAVSMGTPAKPAILNWMGGFVSVNSSEQPFCDFGTAANLPTLPVFTTATG
jgi:hypothetical protein